MPDSSRRTSARLPRRRTSQALTPRLAAHRLRRHLLLLPRRLPVLRQELRLHPGRALLHILVLRRGKIRVMSNE